MKVQHQPTADEAIERRFAERLLELREQRGLTQAKLAEILTARGLDIDPLAILRIEKNAKVEPGSRTVRDSSGRVVGATQSSTKNPPGRSGPHCITPGLMQFILGLDRPLSFYDHARARALASIASALMASSFA